MEDIRASVNTIYRGEEVEVFRTAPRRTKIVDSSNFVVHLPLPQSLLANAARQDGDEFTHITYTAVTVEPDHSEIDAFPLKYQLRQRLFRRTTKVALVITMYNEGPDLFLKSLLAVQRNIAYLCSTRCPFSWGRDGWKGFVVVIVSDGRAKINKKVLTVLEMLGLYVDNLPKTSVEGKAVASHVFEATTQIAIDPADSQILNHKDGIVPTQVIFVLKEQNKKKINSHKWFFSAVCETINPEVTMLLDVGTKPTPSSLYHLYRAFERNEMIGGAAGEIAAELGECSRNLLNPFVAAQNFEYKMSNILDKPLESVFGYISVLPGAFSAYRWLALKGRPLEQYFKGEAPGANIFTSNLYLAEDRILCFELVAKRKEPWLLKYVKNAKAETDVPDTLDELTSQRRRWLNGSFFASLYALMNWRSVYSSPHSTYQKLLFSVQFVYNAINIWFTWFNIANFHLSFYFLFNIRKGGSLNDMPLTDPFYPYGDIVFQTLQGLFLFGLISMIITALGNRPRGTRWLYWTLCAFFSCIMSLMIFMSAWSVKVQIVKFTESNVGASYAQMWKYLVSTPEFRDMVIATSSTYGLYVIASFLALDPWHCVTSMVQYLILVPTYINIFNVYAFCNLHDISWGTKSGAKAETDIAESSETAAKKVTNAEGKTEYEFMALMDGDLDVKWQGCVKKFLQDQSSQKVEKDKRDDKTKKEDTAKSFRTRIVLLWISTNALLSVFFTNDASLRTFFPKNDSTVNPYITFLFWSFAGLAFFRFAGSVCYCIENFKERAQDLPGRSAPSDRNV